MTNMDLLHQVDLDIVKEVVAICEKHGFTYFMLGGTMLGAIRHKGFIPWDDDLDISVLKRDFPRLKKALQEELPDNLIYQDRWTDFNCPIIFAKVRDKHSFFDEYDSRRVKERGIFIDIFPIDRSFESRFKEWKNTAILGRQILLFQVSQLLDYAHVIDIVTEAAPLAGIVRIMVATVWFSHRENVY